MNDTPIAMPGACAGQAVAGTMTRGAVGVRLALHPQLEALEATWRRFEREADCTAFQSFDWLSTWMQHIGSPAGVRPAIVAGHDAQGAMLFLLPLAVVRQGVVRCLTWLGSDLGDYNAPLLAARLHERLDARAFCALWPDILALIQRAPALRFDLVHFVRMPPTVAGQPNPMLGLPLTPHPSAAHRAHLSAPWDAFYASRRSSATRARDRTKRRRLEALGDVRLRAPGEPQDALATIELLMAQKSRQFARMGVDDLFERPGHRAFYRSLAARSPLCSLVHVSRLDVGDTPAALNLGLRHRDCYYHVLSSYEGGDTARFGAGAFHLHELMRHAIDGGCAIFDFTVGDEPYKRDWSDTEVALADHVALARWRGGLSFLRLVAHTRAKRLVKQTPLLWRGYGVLRSAWARWRGRHAQEVGAQGG